MAHNADRALAKPPGIVGPSTHPGASALPHSRATLTSRRDHGDPKARKHAESRDVASARKVLGSSSTASEKETPAHSLRSSHSSQNKPATASTQLDSRTGKISAKSSSPHASTDKRPAALTASQPCSTRPSPPSRPLSRGTRVSAKQLAWRSQNRSKREPPALVRDRTGRGPPNPGHRSDASAMSSTWHPLLELQEPTPGRWELNDYIGRPCSLLAPWFRPLML